EWVHVQLHQQKGMISLSPPTICNSAPEDLMTHTFSELSVFETKGWDHAIKSKIETLAKRETQYLDDAAKAENRRLVTEKLENSLAIAPTKPTRNWLHIAGIACLVVCTFMYVTNKFI
ncbi:hypothetical protein AB2507_18280, partial [Escherichia coli]